MVSLLFFVGEFRQIIPKNKKIIERKNVLFFMFFFGGKKKKIKKKKAQKITLYSQFFF